MLATSAGVVPLQKPRNPTCLQVLTKQSTSPLYMLGNVCIFTFAVSKGCPVTTQAVPPRQAVEVNRVAEGYHNYTTSARAPVLGKSHRKQRLINSLQEKTSALILAQWHQLSLVNFVTLRKKKKSGKGAVTARFSLNISLSHEKKASK